MWIVPEIWQISCSLSRLTNLCIVEPGQQVRKTKNSTWKKWKNNKKTESSWSGGVVFWPPRIVKKQMFLHDPMMGHVLSSWSGGVVFWPPLIVKLQLATKRDRQETNVSSWSGGSFFDPPWSSRFCHKWYLHHFSDSGKLWKNACALVTGVSRKPLPFESSVQFFFPNGLHFFLKLVRWIILFFSLRFSEVSLFAPSFFPLDFLKWACLLPVFFPQIFWGEFFCSHFFPLDFLRWVFLLPFFSLRFSDVSFFAPIFFPQIFWGEFFCSHFFPLDFLRWVFLLPFFSLRFSEMSFFAPIFFP